MTDRHSANRFNLTNAQGVRPIGTQRETGQTRRGHQADFEALISAAVAAEVKKKPSQVARSPFTLLLRLLSLGLWSPAKPDAEATRHSKRIHVLS